MIKYFCENCNTFPFLADAKYLGWIVKDHFVFVWKDLHKGIHGMYMKPTFLGNTDKENSCYCFFGKMLRKFFVDMDFCGILFT